MMNLFKLFLPVFLLLISSFLVFAQTNSLYTAYQISFPYITTCPTDQYYDVALLQCSSCPNDTQQKTTGKILSVS